MTTFEITMLSVGVADAMILRYTIPGNQMEFVVLIDAGNKKDGPKIAEYIRQHTTQKYIDLAICTHPDADHIGGFPYVVEHVRIEEFWIHDPAKHKINAKKLLESWQANTLIKKGLSMVVENLQDSYSLLVAIDRKGIKRREPFAGLQHELLPLTVVGPSESYYEELLGRFRNADLLWEEEQLLEKSLSGGPLLGLELTTRQILNRNNDQSKENNSSVILLFTPDDSKYLFTSDAGPDALNRAAQDYDLSDLDWLDVPHHGSRYNLTTSLIELFKPKIAFISCDGSKHYPNAAVVAELKNAGCKVHATYQTTDLQMRSGSYGGYGRIPSTPI